jgi:hypothetical protein
MTSAGKQCLAVLEELRDEQPDRKGWFTAQEITDRFIKKFGDLGRSKPVMTISSYLTHLRPEGHVERKASSDKTMAWWRSTQKGRRALKR